MLIKTLEQIKVKTKNYQVDLLKNPYYLENLKTGKSLSNGYQEKIVSDIECQPLKKAFTCYDKIYVQLSTGEFCYYDNGTTTSLFSIPGDNKVYELHENNKNRVVVYGSTYGRIIDTEDNIVSSFAFPSVCLGCALYDGSLFGFTSKKVYFSKRHLLTDFVNGGYFSLPTRDEKVMSVHVLGEHLYVFCKKAIYKVFRSESQPMSIEKLKLSVDILNKSIVAIKDKVYFINKNALSVFDGESIQEIPTYIDNKVINSITISGELNGVYFLQGTIDNEKLVSYFYNPENTEQFSTKNLNYLSNFGGVSVSKNNNTLVAKIVLEDSKSPFSYKTFPLDLEIVGKKTIKSIRLNTLGKVSLTAYGDFGQQNFVFGGGYEKKNCNLSSTQFVFELQGQAGNIAIDNFIIEYKTQGE